MRALARFGSLVSGGAGSVAASDALPTTVIDDLVAANPGLHEVRRIHGVPEVVFICWFGGTISSTRHRALRSLRRNLGVPSIVITDANYRTYEHPETPIHDAFELLSHTHKADYLRVYLLHHHGGGYHDVKLRTHPWTGQWEDFRDRDVWIKSRRELRPEWIGYPADQPEMSWLQQEYPSLGTMGWVICRPHTPYTRDLFAAVTRVLTRHVPSLRQHPSRGAAGYYSDRPFGHADEDGYPIRWLELLGESSHPLMYRYRRHLRFGLPDVARGGYK